MATGTLGTTAGAAVRPATMAILLMITAGHFLNDVMQSVLLSIYPLIKDALALSFAQIGLVTLVFQLTASVLQPFVGLYTDKHPQPWSLVAGMGSTFFGILLLASAHSYPVILAAAALIGVGSSIFHPEASRVARLAAGGRFGFAQSLFQTGGNAGQAVGPLLVALLVVPYGLGHSAWFALLALVGMIVLGRVGGWYGERLAEQRAKPKGAVATVSPVPRAKVVLAISVLIALTFSKNFYVAAFTSYYPFYLIDRFGLSIQQANLHLFVFMAASAVGVIAGGPIGDRIGRLPVLWLSIVGVLPFSLALPHLGLLWTDIFAVIIGLVMASAFPAIVVYAQELLPGKVGMVAGLFFGFAFGIGGLGAAALGWLADATSIRTVYVTCSFLPAIGLLAVFLPDLDRASRRPVVAA